MLNFVDISNQQSLISSQPWLDEEHKLLPHQEAALLLEYARDGKVSIIYCNPFIKYLTSIFYLNYPSQCKI